MKLYLSSYKFGNEVEKLKTMLPKLCRIGHINNARDSQKIDSVLREKRQTEEISFLSEIGFLSEPLDLKLFFNNKTALIEKLARLDGLWVSGGNTFILRQAMRLSGFDLLFHDLKQRKSFLYGGYSAGVCVLCNSLKYIMQVDDPNDFPYNENNEIILEGLGLFNYGILPHYNSDHFESKSIDDEIRTCINNKWLFKAIKDGEVLITE